MPQLGVKLGCGDQIYPRNPRQLDIHDDEVRHRASRSFEHPIAVCHRFHIETVDLEHVAEQSSVEVVVLDNHYSLCHTTPRCVFLNPAYPCIEAITIPDSSEHSREAPQSDPITRAKTLALAVLGWVLQDSERAERYLSLTGLDPDSLRAGLDDPAVLGSALEFLANHEPDLFRASEALAVTPEELVAAHRELSA